MLAGNAAYGCRDRHRPGRGLSPLAVLLQVPRAKVAAIYENPLWPQLLDSRCRIGVSLLQRPAYSAGRE